MSTYCFLLVTIGLAGLSLCHSASVCDTAVTDVCKPTLTAFVDLWYLSADDEITEQKITNLCNKSVAPMNSCLKHLDQCPPKNMPDLHELIRGSAQLLNSCKDVKDLFSKAKVMWDCDSKLGNESMKFPACANKFSADIEGWITIVEGSIFSAGADLKTLCCALKRYDTCVGFEPEQKCGTQNSLPNRMAMGALYDAFNCKTRSC